MEDKKEQQARRFVTAILERCREDKGFAACLRRADNPDTEHYAYGVLAGFGIDLENDEERRPCAVIAASLSRSRRDQDGDLGLGEALRDCVKNEEQGESRLRRMLACRTTEELCRMLRPLLTFIDARDAPLCHARLLVQMLNFHREKARRMARLRWAQEYYGRAASDADEQAGEGDA